MVNNWSSSCSTRDSSPPSCWSWSSWIFFVVAIFNNLNTFDYEMASNRSLLQGMCHITAANLWNMKKFTSYVKKRWLKPALPVGNWSQPIMSQSERERKKVTCRSGKRTRMRMGFRRFSFTFVLMILSDGGHSASTFSNHDHIASTFQLDIPHH